MLLVMKIMNNHGNPTGENLAHDANINDSYIPGSMRFFQLDKNIQNHDFLPSKELPNNPIDYLHNVMMEAKICPDVVVAKIDAKKLKPNQSSMAIRNTFMKKSMPFSKYSPDENWIDQRIKKFCIAREEFQRHLAYLKSVKRQTKKRPKLPVYPLPSWDDELNWRYLCLGNNKLGSNLKEEKEPVFDVVNMEIACDNISQIIDLSTLKVGYPPLLRILLRMEPKHIGANLEYQVEWLKNFGFSHHQGHWIYSLLICLEKPLFPSITSSLRDLVRECVNLRSKIDLPDLNKINGLNLIICIIGKYFDQYDMLS